MKEKISRKKMNKIVEEQCRTCIYFIHVELPLDWKTVHPNTFFEYRECDYEFKEINGKCANYRPRKLKNRT
jgi:hypothetical protein